MRDSDTDHAVSAALMPWYDRHARALPWRVGPEALADGMRPDPYRVWLSEIMLQQTTVAAVKEYFHRFTARWPTVTALADAQDADVMAEWAGLGYYARARNLLKCARVVAHQHDGVFPDTEDGLRTLPGIGPYTAAAVAAIAFDRPAAVMDGNVERVLARLFAVQTPLPAAKPELKALAERLTPETRPGCYAQAVMDLGATICTPRSPACGHLPADRDLPRPRAGHRRRSAAQDAETGETHAAGHRLSGSPGRWCGPAGNPGPTGACWAACWAGPAPTGPRPHRKTHRHCPPVGTTQSWRCATPSPISTCACGSCWPRCRKMRHRSAARFAPAPHSGPQVCLR